MHGVFAVVCLLLGPGVTAAAPETTFPRGPGFYFSLPRLITLTIVYLLWVATCSWVERDARALKIAAATWNTLLLGGGVLGLVVVWLLPWFFLSLLVLLALYLAPSLAYVRRRNQCVPAARQLLTERHLKELARRYLKIKFADRPRAAENAEVLVRFVDPDLDRPEGDSDPAGRMKGERGLQTARALVYDAIQRRATEVRLEPAREKTAVRCRVDGIFQAAPSFSRQTGAGVINVFKMLSHLDVDEKRKPQQGTCSAQVEQRTVEFRVSTAGNVAGEKMVLRILDRAQQPRGLTRLGMRPPLQTQVSQLVTAKPSLLIVCGPEDSGKSTTLYACLGEIDRFRKSVVTLENPIEYRLSSVTQIEVNARTGKTFAEELRHVLRQEEHVILLGEVRDRETAELACQAVQAGRLVLTAVEAGDTTAALGQLLELGVPSAVLAGTLGAVLGQRLVRVLCPRCKVRYKPKPEVLRKVNLPADKIKFFCRPPEPEERTRRGEDGQPTICGFCEGSGYFGRTGVFELLVITDPVRDLLRAQPNLSAIRQESVKGGMRSLQDEGLRLVMEGTTSIQELIRVMK